LIGVFSIQYDFLLFFFRLSKSLPNTLIIREVGVTTIKKTKPIIMGDIKFPNKIPNLNQILFKGDNTDEFKRPKIKKIIATTTAQTLTLPSLNNGNKEMIIKNIKKTTPKFLFDEILIFFKFIDLIKNYLIKTNPIYLNRF